MLTTVISGGQTGADRAGLKAAVIAGLCTGGWMPKSFKAQDGFHPEFADQYNMRETESCRYPPRTALNIKESNGTIQFASDFNSPGEVLTSKMVRQYHKPNILVDINGCITPVDVADWIINNNIKILNVAGNSERTSPGIEKYVVSFLTEVFTILLN